MRAVRYSAYGGPEVLGVDDDAPEPHAGPGQVRIRVQAVGVNGFDWKLRRGMMAGGEPLAQARTPGLEASGTVDEVGEGVTGVAVGEDVFGAGSALSAEFGVLDHWERKPPALSFEEAAALPVAVETATRTLDALRVAEGTSLLINAASGSVGLAAVQLAAVRGAAPIVGTASEANHPFLSNLGVRPTLYGPGLAGRVRELAPDGIEAALDAGGRGALPELVEITGSPSRVVTIADFDGAEEHGVSFSGRSIAWGALEQAARLVEDGRLSVPVTGSYRFAEAGEAHRVSENGHVRGKLVLVP